MPVYKTVLSSRCITVWPFDMQRNMQYNICKTVRHMLSDRCLSCLSCLSVTLVYCGQTVGWIKMKLGTQVGLGTGNIVLDGDPAPPPRGHSPQFSAHVYCGQTVVHLSYCWALVVKLTTVTNRLTDRQTDRPRYSVCYAVQKYENTWTWPSKRKTQVQVLRTWSVIRRSYLL